MAKVTPGVWTLAKSHVPSGLTLDRVSDGTGPIPISYTFPDRMMRIAPEFAQSFTDGKAESFLREIVTLMEPPDELLSGLTDAERTALPQVVEDFVVSELVHELYHDWQNRSARFPTVERARARLVADRDAAGQNWLGFLTANQIDADQHDRELAQAELEACSIRRGFWISVYGEDPDHHPASLFRSLIDDSMGYFQSLLSD